MSPPPPPPPLSSLKRITLSPPVYESRPPSPERSPSRLSRHIDTSLLTTDFLLKYESLPPSPVRLAPTHDVHKNLAQAIAEASASEKDLGYRVASASEKIKSWNTEVESWNWTGGFEREDLDVEELRLSQETSNQQEGEDYWGSLPVAQVNQYNVRINQIQDGLEALEIDELKESIRYIHAANRSRPSSRIGDREIALMDDFSISITQTFLQCLPTLGQLQYLLEVWSTRLALSRVVPKFLDGLKQAQEALRVAWEAISPDGGLLNNDKEDKVATIGRIKDALRGLITQLGQRLDRMLDMLEGKNDCLPDKWIDEFEELEAEYVGWSSAAERIVLELEMGPNKKSVQKPGEGQEGQRVDSVVLGEEEGRLSSSPPEEATTTRLNLLRVDTGSAAHKRTISVDTTLSDETFVLDEDDAEFFEEDPVFVRPNLTQLKRASIASIESIPRSKVKSIDLGRHSNASVESVLRNSAPVTPVEPGRSDSTRFFQFPMPPSSVVAHQGSPLRAIRTPIEISAEEQETEEMLVVENTAVEPLSATPSLELEQEQLYIGKESPDEPRPSTLSIAQDHGNRSRTASISSIDSPENNIPPSPISITNESPIVQRMASRRLPKPPPPPPLNAQMAKRRLQIRSDSQAKPFSPKDQSGAAGNASPTKTPINETEQLERQISSILTTIPANIRLESRSHSHQDARKTVHRISSANLSRPHAPRPLSQMHYRPPPTPSNGTPQMTLSPAKSDHAVDGAQLYHLSQPGKDAPIKLFVRRVGENGERVMVRIGGGWADLGEYLRSYAEHHGRRTVSEGRFEVLGLNTPSLGDSPPPKSKFGKSEGVTPGQRPGSSHRPSSRISVRAGTEPPTGLPAKEPPRQLGTGSLGPSSGRRISDEHTRRRRSSESTAGEPGSNESRRSWTGEEVGLAGPKVKRLELSGEKKGWVEEMLSQAKKAAGGNGGGVKRVFLKEGGRG